ncbi:hypothetical protein CBR_g29783 [Chara braunii]|uniref:Uncharacterized protein n=1 Tax=Chara braunii TaxID=69332 RepID=A0A388LBS0_CHABU|nr:hypothetical protein CBR_g29783 [Chara braunii]|eukprot:GBG79633.1 hypothetical protein CBR_g29783 [Chara braunii]
MDIPLWYVRTYTDDRPEDDDMTSRQEFTILRLTSLYHDALRGGQWSDDGKMSQSRLSRIGDAFCLHLAACMWIMHMGVKDARSHEEASYYSQLVAKPTLIAAGAQTCSWRMHIVQSANAILTRLGKPPFTTGVFPNYISEWATCGMRFNYNAGLVDPDITPKMKWMGTGPSMAKGRRTEAMVIEGRECCRSGSLAPRSRFVCRWS